MKRTRKTKRVPRIRRASLGVMLPDLAERLDRQVQIGLAIQKTQEPNGEHTVAEHELRTVFGLLLESQLRNLRDIRDVARMLCPGEAR